MQLNKEKLENYQNFKTALMYATMTKKDKKFIDNEEKIDNYLRGRMTSEEEKKFLEECQSDKELKQQAYMTALLVKALKKN